MPVRIEFDTDNAAFEGPDGWAEVARILREAADRIERSRGVLTDGAVRDVNGNTVGSWEATVGAGRDDVRTR